MAAPQREGRVPLVVHCNPASYRPSVLHSGDRIWTETNCYTDLWIELLSALGHDPVPSLAAALSATFDGDQWTFIKPWPEDLRALYGLDVGELTVWRPLAEHLRIARESGDLLTIEVDSWWLPDTAATDYRRNHVKTAIVPVEVDEAAKRMHYLHNAGMFSLDGDDFERVLTDAALPPYTEYVRQVQAGDIGRLPGIIGTHLALSDPDAVAALGEGVRRELPSLAERGVDHFHKWSFATLRQCGAGAALAADLVDYLTSGRREVSSASESDDGPAAKLRTLAQMAKSLQFAVARAARGRAVSVDEPLAEMDRLWRDALTELTETWA